MSHAYSSFVLKVELHAHTDDDPLDRIGHSTEQLIDRAAALGYDAIAVTLHNRYFDPVLTLRMPASAASS